MEPSFSGALSTYTTGDANTEVAYGVQVRYLSAAASNKPTGTDHALLTMSYSSSWAMQMAGDWRTNEWYVRNLNSSVWGGWSTLLHSGNYSTYAPTKTGTGASGTWGISISGTAANASAVAWSGVSSKPTTLVGYGITDATPSSHVGTGSTAHANAVASGDAGFMTGADKTKLDGIATGATANTGTVTSIGGTGTVSGLTLTGSITTTGNLTLAGTLAVLPSNFASQTANTVLIAPNGISGVPTFRALVAADIPTLNQNTSGTASNITGTLAVANGGTGVGTLTGIVKGNGTGVMTAAIAGTDFVAPATLASYALLASPSFTGNVSVAKTVSFTPTSISATTTSTAVSFINGQKQTINFNTGSTTTTITLNMAGVNTTVGSYQLLLNNNIAMSTITWAAGTNVTAIRWVQGTASPTLNMAINTQNIVSLYYDGTYIYLAASKIGAV